MATGIPLSVFVQIAPQLARKLGPREVIRAELERNAIAEYVVRIAAHRLPGRPS